MICENMDSIVGWAGIRDIPGLGGELSRFPGGMKDIVKETGQDVGEREAVEGKKKECEVGDEESRGDDDGKDVRTRWYGI